MNTIQLHSSKVLFGILILLLSTSCSDFLEENPENLVATSNYYTTEQDAIAAVNSIYAYLGSYDASRGSTAGIYHSTFWITHGLASDEMLNNQLGTPQYDQLARFSHNADNAALLEIWQIHYKTIYLANIAIDRIPLIDMDPALQDRFVNEAKFLRGLLYFNMVRMFGEIPLVVSEDASLNPESAPVSAIYDQIIIDLTDAESLPVDGDIQQGRATKGAAKGILAKVYLRMGEFQLAADKAKEVIDSGQYDLWDDFTEAFDISSRGGKEAVFSVGFGDGGGAISFWEVGQFHVRLLPTELSREVDGVSNTQGWQIAVPDLYNSYGGIDERQEATFMTNFMASDGTTINLDMIYIDKYWDREANPTADDSFNDFPVLRYSDILLTYAEAQARLDNFSEANDYLNMVRERAGLDDVNTSTMEEFIDVLLSERRKEFVAEGMRWFDLTRLGRLEEAVQEAKNINVGSEYYLYPIPQRERDVNPNLPQNPGF